MFLLLLTSLAAADDYAKVICVCTRCISYNSNCDNQPTLDAQSNTFLDDFTAARRNVKDIHVIFNTNQDESAEFDMRILSGLNINFTSYLGDIDLQIKYVNRADYSGTNMGFGRYVFATFSPTEASNRPNMFNIGSLIGPNAEFFFPTGGNRPNELYVGSYDLQLKHFKNFSAVYKNKVGDVSIVLSRYDRLSLIYSQELQYMMINDTEMMFSFNHLDNVLITGAYTLSSVYKEKLSIILDESFNINNLPNLTFGSLSYLELSGKFGAPSEENPIKTLYRIANINLSPGDFPFSIYSNICNLVINGDTTIYGAVDAYSWLSYTAIMEITSPLETKAKLTFAGLIDCNIEIKSPYVDIDIYNMTANDTTSSTTTFPISFAFNENAFSAVNIREINFWRSGKASTSTFKFYSAITNFYSDAELDNLPNIKNGFTFLDLPKDTLDVVSFKLSYLSSSPSLANSVPGFTESSNCMGIIYNSGDRFKLTCKKVRSAFLTPLYICVTLSSSCNYISGVSGYPYRNVASIDNGDLSQYIRGSYTTVVVGSTYKSEELYLNFDTLPSSVTNVTFIGESTSITYTTLLSFQNNQNKVKTLSVERTKFSKDTNFNMDSLLITNCYFATDKTYTFNSNLDITTDIFSYKQLMTVSQTYYFKNLTVIPTYYWDSSYYPYEYDDEITINNDILQVCMVSIGYYYDYDICANFNNKYISNMTFISENELKFTANSYSSDFKPLTIDIRKEYLYSRAYLYVKGNGWLTPMTNKIKVYYDDYPLTISLDAPGQTDNFEIIGKGHLLYQLDYGYSTSYCIFNSTAPKTCKTSYGTNQFENDDNVTNKILDINKMYVIFQADESYRNIQIPFSYFNNRRVILRSHYNNPLRQTYELNMNVTSIDQRYSLIEFEKINLEMTQTTPQTITMGQVKITNCTTSDNFKNNADLKISQLICNYQDLTNFKSLTITDQLNVSGVIANTGTETVVTFNPDDDANDLVANIDTDATIIVGREFVKIGDYKFNIKQSSNYDAYFFINGDSNIRIECEQGVQANQFPRIVLDGKNSKVNYTFVGNFPSISAGVESLIMVRGKYDAKLFIEGNAPISIIESRDIEIHVSSTTNTIHGPIEYNSDSYSRTVPRIRFFNDGNQKSKVVVTNGIRIMEIEKVSKFIGISSANLEVEIKRIVSSKDTLQSNITLYSTISRDGGSFLKINGALPTGILYSSPIIVDSQVFGQIDDESRFPFISSAVSIIQANADDIRPFDFFFIYVIDDSLTDRTHGFYATMNCLELLNTRVSNDLYALQLKAAKAPSDIPFIIDIVEEGQITAGELVITERNADILNDLSRSLPSKFVGVYMNLYTDMPYNFPLDLTPLVAGRSDLFISIQTAPRVKAKNAFITIPQSNVLNLSFTDVRLNFVNKAGSASVQAKVINFTNCLFANPSDITISSTGVNELLVDVDSLNELVTGNAMTSFSNPILVQSANIIKFTATGWQFQENYNRDTALIDSGMFPQLSFVTHNWCILQIVDSTINSIKGFKLNAYPSDDGVAYFEFSRFWKNINDTGGMQIDVHGAKKVSANTASYPIPKMFNVDDNDIDYVFETDYSTQFDTITIADGRVFENEIFHANFKQLPSQYQFVKGTSATFAGNSAISFDDGLGTLQLDSVTIANRANVNFSNLQVYKELIMNKESKINGKVSFGLTSKFEVHWTLNEPPVINQSEFVTGAPQYIQLIYADSSVDKEQYNQRMVYGNGLILVKGNFECYNYRRQVRFGGNYKPFGADNTYLSLDCDSSSEGQVLVIRGLKEIDDKDEDPDDSQSGDKSGAKLGGGGIAGIVIAIAVVVGVCAAGVVYYFQRIKIDKLKNEIPADGVNAYKTSQYETQTSSDALDAVQATEDPFDDV